MEKFELPRSGNHRKLLRNAYDARAPVQKIRLSVCVEGEAAGSVYFSGADAEKMNSREKAVQPVKGCRKHQRDYGLVQSLYDADIEKSVFCVGVRAESQASALKTAVHYRCEVSAAEYHAASVVKNKLYRRGAKRQKLFQGCSYVSQFPEVQSVQQSFHTGGNRLVADGGVKAAAAAYGKIFLLFSKVSPSQIDTPEIRRVENIFYSLYRVSGKTKGTGEIIARSRRNIAEGDF